MEFQDWFHANSGYALHRARFRPLSGCCARDAAPDGRLVWLPERETPLPLYRCPACGRLYARLGAGFFPIGHPLRYRIGADPPEKNPATPNGPSA